MPGMDHAEQFVARAEHHFESGSFRKTLNDLQYAWWNITEETTEETHERLQRVARRLSEEQLGDWQARHPR
jgi:response regulator RpfG family c-di-GMP phosphodiesterase